MKNKMAMILALAVFITAASAAFAQEMSTTAALATAIAKKQKTEDRAGDSLRKEVVRLKYVQAQTVQQILLTFMGPRGRVVANPGASDILALSDTPENVEKMLAAIREIDVKPADVLFTIQLVLGSETEDKTDPELQGEPVIKELKKLLRYAGYSLQDATMVRSIDREKADIILGRKAEFRLEIRPEVAREKPLDSIRVWLRLRQISERFVMKDGKEVRVPAENAKDIIQSQLNLKSGDKSVVGVSKLDGGDKGLILIVSAKVVD